MQTATLHCWLMTILSGLGQFLVIFLQMTAGKTCDPGRSVGVDLSSHEFHQSGVSNEHSGKQKCCQITCRRIVSMLLQCLKFYLMDLRLH